MKQLVLIKIGRVPRPPPRHLRTRHAGWTSVAFSVRLTVDRTNRTAVAPAQRRAKLPAIHGTFALADGCPNAGAHSCTDASPVSAANALAVDLTDVAPDELAIALPDGLTDDRTNRAAVISSDEAALVGANSTTVP